MTETDTEHRYTYPEPADIDPPTEPGVHRAGRRPESSAIVLIRALGWAAFWFVMTAGVSGWARGDQPYPSAASLMTGVMGAGLALLAVAAGHRRRSS